MLERNILTTMIRAVRRLNPALLAKDDVQLLKPVTMSLFGVLNWSYLWFREDGPLSRDDYARFVTRLFVEGVGRLTAEDGRERRAKAPARSSEPEKADNR